MVGFDDTEEVVVVSPRGRKRRRKPEEHDRSRAKKVRHSGGTPRIACVHNIANVCQAATFSPEEITYINQTFYATTDKVKQDATLLSYMDVKTVKRRRSKVENPSQQKARDVTVKYSVLTRAQERIPVCKSTFMSLFYEQRQIADVPSTGAVIGGILGTLAVIGIIVGVILYVRKRPDEDGPPKHKPPPPVKTGSSTEMNLDDDGSGGALNGGAKYDNMNDSLHGNDFDQANHDAGTVNIARGESFVSPAMYV